MNIKLIISTLCFVLLTNSIHSRTVKFQNILYKQYNSDMDSHTFYFQNAEQGSKLNINPNSNGISTGSFEYSTGNTYLLFLVRSNDNSSIVTSSITLNNISDSTLLGYYRSFILQIDGSPNNNKKHYVVYNFSKLTCTNLKDYYPYYSYDVKYFDCADQAREFYANLLNNDSGNISYRYDKDSTSKVVQSNGFIQQDVSSGSFGVPPEEIIKGNGLFSLCANAPV